MFLPLPSSNMKNFLKTSPQSSTKTEHAPQRSKVKERLPQQQKTRDDIAKSLISLKKKRDKALRKSGDLEKILLMDDYNKKVDDIRTTENYKFAQEGWKGKLEELYSSNLEEFSDFLRNILGYMSEEDQKTIF
ncbi:hypothetical protein FACS189428_5650 [Clostridia bacterium]|nr:hypothetical protein FACS189428_5650 [Clostridia bacterium]